MADQDSTRSFLTLFVASLEGLCTGLRFAIEHKTSVSYETTKSYLRLERMALSKWKGAVIDGWEPLDTKGEYLNASDLLVRSEILRACAVAFATPDERDEMKAASSFGLAQWDPNTRARNVPETVARRAPTAAE